MSACPIDKPICIVENGRRGYKKRDFSFQKDCAGNQTNTYEEMEQIFLRMYDPQNPKNKEKATDQYPCLENNTCYCTKFDLAWLTCVGDFVKRLEMIEKQMSAPVHLNEIKKDDIDQIIAEIVNAPSFFDLESYFEKLVVIATDRWTKNDINANVTEILNKLTSVHKNPSLKKLSKVMQNKDLYVNMMEKAKKNLQAGKQMDPELIKVIRDIQKQTTEIIKNVIKIGNYVILEKNQIGNVERETILSTLHNFEVILETSNTPTSGGGGKRKRKIKTKRNYKKKKNKKTYGKKHGGLGYLENIAFNFFLGIFIVIGAPIALGIAVAAFVGVNSVVTAAHVVLGVAALVPYKDKSYTEDFKAVLGSYKEALWFPGKD
jgi:hypothetical protein